MGFKLITDEKPVTVFRHDGTSKAGNAYTSYSLGVSSKDANGEWVSGFMNCRFRKGVDIPNKAKINVKNAFPTVSEYNGNTNISWFILDYEVVEQPNNNDSPLPSNASNDGFMNIPDGIENELPFS